MTQRRHTVLLSILVALCAAIAGMGGYQLAARQAAPVVRQTLSLTLPPSGTFSFDDPDPASGITGCTEWTWLEQSCYASTAQSAFGASPKMVLGQDLAAMQANHWGRFFRLWVSLDQGMVSHWDPTTGWTGTWDTGFLADVDDALHQIANAGDTVDLVLYSNSASNPTTTDTATATVSGGSITGIAVAGGASDYAYAPDVIISGGGCKDVTAYVTETGGSLSTTATITNNGGGTCTGTPVVTLWGGNGNGDINNFHPEALDGNHATMQTNYLSALTSFLDHIAADALDTQAVAVVDLMNEAYYQFHGTGKIFATASGLGQWDSATDGDGTPCEALTSNPCTGNAAGGFGCVNGGSPVTACVEVAMLYPFFHSLYTTAKASNLAVPYTLSDGDWDLISVAGGWYAQSTQEAIRPWDAYDIHMYQDTPWSTTNVTRLALLRNLTPPDGFFVGEAGCTASSCTYNGTTALPEDAWWLANLPAYGAEAVLVEAHQTIYGYGGSGSSLTYTPSLVGALLGLANGGAPHARPFGPR